MHAWTALFGCAEWSSCCSSDVSIESVFFVRVQWLPVEQDSFARLLERTQKGLFIGLESHCMMFLNCSRL